MDSTKDFQWIGQPVNCPYETLKTGKYTFYSSFEKSGELYKIGEFVKVNRRDRENPLYDEICRLICIYESREERHYRSPLKGFVQPYIYAKKLGSLLQKNSIKFDENNEVLEDRDGAEVIINLVHIKSKCHVIHATVKDPVYLITRLKLDKQHNYSCRYRYENNIIVPLFIDNFDDSSFSNDNVIISDCKEPLTDNYRNVTSDSKSGTPSNKNVYDIKNNTSTKNASYKILKEKKIVPKEKENNMKETKKEVVQSVRRNLCNSFESEEDESSLLNYSIVHDVLNTEDNLKLKFKKSSKQKNGLVVRLEKLSIDNSVSPAKRSKYSSEIIEESFNNLRKKEDNFFQKCLSPLTGDVKIRSPRATKENESHIRKDGHRRSTRTVSSVRKSQRNIQRISYAEYISPIKFSPQKRPRLASINTESNDNINIDNKENRVESPDVVVESNLLKTPQDKKRTTARAGKFYYYISESESESDSPSLVIFSKRQTRIPKRDFDELCITPKKTPRLKNSENTHLTPKLRNMLLESTHKSTQKGTPKGTPRSRVKLLRNGSITPSVQSRNKSLSLNTTPLMKARSQLHVSYVPKTLPCREKEFEDLSNFLVGKLLDGCGGCMYVSGVPGTGKTATVTCVVNTLLQRVKSRDVPEFSFISINGMKMTEPRQAYVEILKQLINKTVPWEQALGMLEDKLLKSKKHKTPIVIIIDELDILCTKRQDVVYNLLDWPSKAKTQLIVITIANTMDLPERLLMSRVTSRLGLTRLTFQAYTHKQLQEIVMKRLQGTNSFNPDAVQLVARNAVGATDMYFQQYPQQSQPHRTNLARVDKHFRENSSFNKLRMQYGSKVRNEEVSATK